MMTISCSNTYLRLTVVCTCAFLLLTGVTDAELIAHYQMNSPTQLLNNVGATTYRPDMANPGGANEPTYLPAGGVDGSGAFQFDGVDDYLAFSGVGYTFLAGNGLDWSVSFWIVSTDTNAYTGYAGTPQLPVLGNDSGGIGFGLGVDAGRAAYRRYSGSWYSAQGNKNVADGAPHYVTFVAVGSSNLNIYVNGRPDVLNQSVPASGSSQLGVHVGRSYGPKFGAFTLDDLRVYDHALTAEEVETLFAAPPSGTVILIR